MTAIFGLAMGVGVVLIATGTAIPTAKSDRPLVCLRFEAARAMLPTANQSEVLTYSPNAEWPAPDKDLAGVDLGMTDAALSDQDIQPQFVSRYSGLLWGVDSENYAGQWEEFIKAARDLNAPIEFSASTRVAGRNMLFAWHGFCNNVIDIRRHTDRSHMEFWTELQLLETLFQFSTDSRSAFDHIAQRAGSQLVRRLDGTNAARERVEAWTIAGTSDHPVRHSLWLIYHSDSEENVRRWVYMSSCDKQGRTYLWDVTLSHLACNANRTLAQLRSDIPVVHSDVGQINSIGIRDFTGLGHWDRPGVIFLDPSDETLRRSSIMTWGQIGSFLIAVAGLVLCRQIYLRR